MVAVDRLDSLEIRRDLVPARPLAVKRPHGMRHHHRRTVVFNHPSQPVEHQQLRVVSIETKHEHVARVRPQLHRGEQRNLAPFAQLQKLVRLPEGVVLSQTQSV